MKNNTKLFNILAAVAIILLSISQNANAQKVTAKQLQKYCKEVQRGSVGKYYNKISAQKCNSYMNGFFDSAIIWDRLTKTQHFCIPDFLPTTQNTTILDQWIVKNKDTADTTTAAVALFAAFKIAFPCK